MKRFLEVIIILGILGFIGYHAGKWFDIIPGDELEVPTTDSIPSDSQIDSLVRTASSPTKEIPFKVEGNSMYVKGIISGYVFNFVFDTGCSDVQISEVEYKFLRKEGVVGVCTDTITATLADGSEMPLGCFTLEDLEIEGVKVGPVKCFVSPNPDAPLLMGYNVLKKLGTVQIDHKNNKIKIVE